MFWTIFLMSYFLLGATTAICFYIHYIIDQKKQRLRKLLIQSQQTQEQTEEQTETENGAMIAYIVLWPLVWVVVLGFIIYWIITTGIRKLSEAIYEKVIAKL